MFEWDDNKNNQNIDKHGIDFEDAKEIWHNLVIEKPSSQNYHGELRIEAVGAIDGHIITVIYTPRGDNKRIISVRKSRENEKEAYEKAFLKLIFGE